MKYKTKQVRNTKLKNNNNNNNAYLMSQNHHQILENDRLSMEREREREREREMVQEKNQYKVIKSK